MFISKWDGCYGNEAMGHLHGSRGATALTTSGAAIAGEPGSGYQGTAAHSAAGLPGTPARPLPSILRGPCTAHGSGSWHNSNG